VFPLNNLYPIDQVGIHEIVSAAVICKWVVLSVRPPEQVLMP
jgi:hypothetical protein